MVAIIGCPRLTKGLSRRVSSRGIGDKIGCRNILSVRREGASSETHAGSVGRSGPGFGGAEF